MRTGTACTKTSRRRARRRSRHSRAEAGEARMGGFFGVVSREDCVADLFYGTDYHSHLGTARGGMVVRDAQGFRRNIHDISNTPFRTKFEDDLPKYGGATGVGVISDTEDQPLLIASHHGTYAIVTVGRLDNVDALARAA